MKANLSKAVYLFAAPLSQTARVVDALRAKVEEQGDAAPVEAAAETPAEAPAEATTDVAEGGDESLIRPGRQASDQHPITTPPRHQQKGRHHGEA